MIKEIWKPICEDRALYEVSTQGRIKSLRRNKILKPYVCTKGYLQVDISGKAEMVHRLIAIAFIPNPNNKPTVNHKNGIKADNRLENLEWATLSEQQIHSFRVLNNKTRAISVYQSTKDGIFINRFNSAKEAELITGIDNCHINHCLHKKRKSAGGFIWSHNITKSS